jgi:hypothetical protein
MPTIPLPLIALILSLFSLGALGFYWLYKISTSFHSKVDQLGLKVKNASTRQELYAIRTQAIDLGNSEAFCRQFGARIHALLMYIDGRLTSL